MPSSDGLPWRGASGERPPLPVPPERMPMRMGRRLRKRWRWVGAFQEELMIFGAVIEIGPAGMSFWGVYDRERDRLYERTRRALPWRRPEVVMDGRRTRISSEEVEAELEFGEGEAIECVCPNGQGGYTWTRKLAGAPVTGRVAVGGREVALRGLGVEDDSAGYHQRHTVWKWSAGVGATPDGRPVGWNLVTGINDPPENSERAVWVGGDQHEPGPVSFEELDAIGFADGSKLSFTAETQRDHSERIPLVARSEYHAPFGRFEGALDGVEIEAGLGVMESHDVLW